MNNEQSPLTQNFTSHLFIFYSLLLFILAIKLIHWLWQLICKSGKVTSGRRRVERMDFLPCSSHGTNPDITRDGKGHVIDSQGLILLQTADGGLQFLKPPQVVDNVADEAKMAVFFPLFFFSISWGLASRKCISTAPSYFHQFRLSCWELVHQLSLDHIHQHISLAFHTDIPE